MQDLGNNSLARPVLTGDQHIGIRWAYTRNDLKYRLHGCRLCDQLRLSFTSQKLVFGFESLATPEGRPELPRLLRRHGLTAAWRIGQAQRWCPVQYVVFDLLYHRGRCWLREPLARRRSALAALCAGLDLPEVLFSAGVVGAGTALYALALAQGHEGVVAKRLDSTYRPGRRSPTWRKIKPGGRAKRSEG